jgi:hypothetical protein
MCVFSSRRQAQKEAGDDPDTAGRAGARGGGGGGGGIFSQKSSLRDFYRKDTKALTFNNKKINRRRKIPSRRGVQQWGPATRSRTLFFVLYTTIHNILYTRIQRMITDTKIEIDTDERGLLLR